MAGIAVGIGLVKCLGACPEDLYYHVNAQHSILLFVAYAKNEQEDLGRRQIQILANHVKSEFP